MSENISWILNFIKGKDKTLRLISVNQGFNTIRPAGYTHTICKYTDKKLEERGFKGLKQLTFKDMRENWEIKKESEPKPEEKKRCWWIRDICVELCKNETKYRKKITRYGCNWEEIFFNAIEWMLFISMVFVFVPIWLLSKIVQILFPWIIVGYLVFSGLLISGEIDSFQIVMLGIYIGLQLLVIMLTIKVGRIHYILYHLNPPGSVNLNVQTELLISRTNEYYDEICWYPPTEKILINVYGGDIAAIIIDYCRNIKLSVESV